MHQVEQGPAEKLRLELEDAIVDGFGEYTNNLFKGLVPDDSKIRDFLRHTRHYSSNKKRWNDFPNCNSGSLSALRRRVAALMQEIYDHFNISNRHVICNKKRLSSKFTIEPDMMISGWGSSSFKGRAAQPLQDYVQCATPIAVRFYDQMKAEDMHVQLAIYARECFAAQLNRRFVYALWFTDDMLAVHQFDRSGCIWSEGIDIHESPELAVRWILGASSSDEVAMGFNTTIRWRGRRRYVQTLNLEQEPAEYEIDLTGEVHHSPCIVGPGFTCWPLVGDDGTWLMREYWRELKDPCEEEFLVAARGLPGVAQIVSYEVGEKTSDLRGVKPPIKFRPRQFIRITVRQYGLAISQFRSPLELLQAFKDAVQGHQNLLSKGILHRNISCDNILLGREHCTPGDRGILANLDRATWDYKPRNWDELWPVGSCPFQSIAVIKGGNGRYTFLDDLESFFYVLLLICVSYEEAGKRKDPPSVLNPWYHTDRHVSSASKSKLLRSFDEHFPQHISPYFGPIFVQLLKDLLAIFWTGGLPTNLLQPLTHLEKSRRHLLVDPSSIYRAYFASIDHAIE
ncbi:hypothetical protein AX16_009759, partial [Volvariella volvacea WC 439]